ncbi:hypothetical protein [Burkholderia oklahomensis]|uniref:hypothetical protein n=1 Tax=Burkholderia oklahomensis TaxID=342113 RepID=UPI00119821EC|nr:hypothetical protein [Burkholderia oklahomensis]
MSDTGRFAAGMGANLAKGIGRVATDKAASMMDLAKERVMQTTGGKTDLPASRPFRFPPAGGERAIQRMPVIPDG